MNLGTPTELADLPRLEARLRSLLTAEASRDVLCDVGRLQPCDGGLIDGLARLQLTAHRYGARMVLTNVAPELHELLQLAGLCEIVGCVQPTDGSGIQAQGQAEEREPALGVEEEGDPADPIA